MTSPFRVSECLTRLLRNVQNVIEAFVNSVSAHQGRGHRRTLAKAKRRSATVLAILTLFTRRYKVLSQAM